MKEFDKLNGHISGKLHMIYISFNNNGQHTLVFPYKRQNYGFFQ
jgi:hypothetical protein